LIWIKGLLRDGNELVEHSEFKQRCFKSNYTVVVSQACVCLEADMPLICSSIVDKF